MKFWAMKQNILIKLCGIVLAVFHSSNVLADNTPASYLALGDSYTIGEGVDQAERWPVLLQQGLPLKINPAKIIARTGWRTDDLLAAIQQSILAASYDLVTLMIGVNDQYQGVAIEKFTVNLETLIKKAMSLAGDNASHVLLISIPDWGYSPFGESVNQARIDHQIDNFNAVLKFMASKYQLAFADVTTVSRKVSTQDFTNDGLHPSRQQYQRWVDQAILPKVSDILSTQ